MGTSTAPRACAPSGDPGAKCNLGCISALPLASLRPSPENEKLYRPVDPNDQAIIGLARDIARNGLQEPLIVTADRFIISGHRRHIAAKLAELRTVPCVIKPWMKDDRPEDFLQLLAGCNRQRVKTRDEILREAIVTTDPDAAYQDLLAYRAEKATVPIKGITIRGEKKRARITKAKRPLLEAVKKVLERLRDYWPLSDRKIHYELLNDPPPYNASHPDALYENTEKCYDNQLVDILSRGRVAGEIPWEAIGDETRPIETWNVYPGPEGFFRNELDEFLRGYWRDRMQSQPNQIEIVCEKNTARPILQPVAAEFCIPMTTGRGYCSLAPRRKMLERWESGGKERLIIIFVCDFDPEGEDMPHSFARATRDDFKLADEDITAIKAGLTAEQVVGLGLPESVVAKESSTRYKRFVRDYGEHAHELEAVSPETLQGMLRKAICGVIDIDAYNAELAAEQHDAKFLAARRKVAVEAMGVDL